MAKSGTAGLKPRRIRSREERNAGRGGFITLKKKGDNFLGYALFVPDPEKDDNPGYYEYAEHYTPATSYCPCAGDGCPLCEEGDNPSTRAKTLWLIDDELKVFTLNYYGIEDFEDILEEGDNPVLGQAFRITRKSGQGQYGIQPKNDKLTKAQLKAALKDVDDDYLENLATKQMRRVLEEMDASHAMEEDDPADDAAEAKENAKAKGKSTARKGKAVEEEPEDDAFDPDEATEAEDLEVVVVKLKKKDNILVVKAGESDEFELYGTDEIDLTGCVKGEAITVDFEKDADGDFVVSAIGEATPEEPEEKEGDEPDSYEDATVEIVSVNTDEDTLTVKDEDDNEFDLYFLGEGEDDDGQDWKDLDFADYEDGQMVTITAARDEDGDMLASKFPQPVKSKSSSKKQSGKKKSGKK